MAFFGFLIFALGQMILVKPSLAASAMRWSICCTCLISPPSPISPMAHVFSCGVLL